MLETEDRIEEQQGAGINPDQYWCLAEPTKLVPEIKRRRTAYIEQLRECGLLDRIKVCYAYYHGCFYEGNSIGDSRIQVGGEDDEWSLMADNQFRSVLSLLKTYITSGDVAWDAIAKKSSYSTIEATKRANEFLDCITSSPDSGFQSCRKNAVEDALVLSCGYGWVYYDQNLGKEEDADEQGVIYKEGDFRCLNPSILDVTASLECQFSESPHVTVRRKENKFDLCATYPDLKEEIMKSGAMETAKIDDVFAMGPDKSHDKKTSDMCWVYYFYHHETPACPKGRYVRFVNEKAILRDGELEGCVPVHQLLPSRWLLSPFGYSVASDLVGPQEALHLAANTIISNQNLFGGGHIQFPSGQPVRIGDIEGLGTVLQSDGDIKPLQFLSNPAELFKAVELWGTTIEKISGVNSSARGQPNPSQHSARAIEFTEQRTQQMASDIVANVRQFTAEFGTSILKILAYHGGERDYTTETASGQKETKSITPEVLESLDKVRVVEGNPQLGTIEGRVKLTETLIQMGVVKDPTKIVNVMKSGDMDPLTDVGEGQDSTIKAENELLMQKIAPPPPYKFDNHWAHLRGHLAAISNPKTRGEIEIAFVGAHMEQHLEFARNPEVMAICALLYPDYLPAPALPPTMMGGAPMPGGEGASPGGPPVPPQEPKPGALPGPGAPPGGASKPAPQIVPKATAA